MDRPSCFNNGSDDVRFLEEDVTTVPDAYTFGATDYDVSWYRSPDGGVWQGVPTSSPTNGTFDNWKTYLDTYLATRKRTPGSPSTQDTPRGSTASSRREPFSCS